MTRVLPAAAFLGAVIVTAIVLTSLLVAVYPGVFELTAPVLCPDHQPDAFVVNYSSGGREAGSVSTLFCMGDRGEFTEAGTWRPLALVFGAVASILVAVALLLALVVRSTRASHA